MGKSNVGVEITEESVRAVEVSTGRTPQILAYGEVPLPPDVARDSEVLDQGTVAVAVRQLWTQAGIRSKSVTLGIASRRVLVREYSTAVMAPDLLRQALPFQVQDLLPVPVNQAVLDYYPILQTGAEVHGLLVAAVADTIEQIIATFARAKIRVAGVDLSAFGLARAAARIANEGTVAVVHAGDHTTQVVVVRDGVPEFVRIIPIDLDTAAVRRREGHIEADETLELALVPDFAGSAGIVPRSGTLRADIGGRSVSDFVARIRSTLSFYLDRPGAASIGQVLLSGAGSAGDGLVPALGDAVELPVRVVSVTDVLPVGGAAPVGETALNLVSTAGLALGKDR